MGKHISGVIRIMILLCAWLTVCAMAGSAEAQAELPTITVFTARVDNSEFDGDMIEQALDAYVSDKIGAHINLEFIEIERYNLLLNKYAFSNSMPDVFLTISPETPKELWDLGVLSSLNELLCDDGQGILQCVGADILSTHADDEAVYAVPCLIDRAICLCFVYRERIAEQYGLNIEEVTCIDDLTQIFDALHEQNPDIIPLDIYYDQQYDPLEDGLGVLLDFGQSTKVENLYASRMYLDRCERINDWYHKGYLLDTDTGWTANNAFVRTEEMFGRLSRYNPDMPYNYTISSGETIKCVILSDTYAYTDTYQDYGWAIAKSSEYPREAMRFLNLMYTDENVMNLLCYGIEGIHYRLVDRQQGVIDFPQEVDTTTSGYAQFRNYYYGNGFITYLWNGHPLDLHQQIQEFNDSAAYSCAFGFDYDPTPVQKETDACLKIVDEYVPVLDAGIGDAKKLLAALCRELEAAGIDRIIEEKQRQLDSFLAQKEGL